MITDAEIEAVYRARRPMLLAVAGRSTKSVSDAEDIVSAAFVRLLQARAAIRSPEYAGTWLYATTVNLCRDRARYARAMKREGTVPMASWFDRADPRPSPDAAVLVDEVLRDVRRPELFRRIYIQGERYQDVAADLGVPINTLKTRIKRARDAYVRQVAPAA